MALLPFWRRRPTESSELSTLFNERDSSEQLRADIGSLVESVLHSAGIPRTIWDLELLLALPPAGRPVYSAQLRLTAWDGQAGVRLLLGLPIIERSVRRKFNGSWMHDLCDFDRLWLSPDCALDRATLGTLRGLILALEQGQGATASGLSQPTVDPREVDGQTP